MVVFDSDVTRRRLGEVTRKRLGSDSDATRSERECDGGLRGEKERRQGENA